MLYYRVNKQHYNGKHELVQKELLTARELENFYPEIIVLHYIKRGILTEVHVSSNSTFKSFGCRFEITK